MTNEDYTPSDAELHGYTDEDFYDEELYPASFDDGSYDAEELPPRSAWVPLKPGEYPKLSQLANAIPHRPSLRISGDRERADRTIVNAKIGAS